MRDEPLRSTDTNFFFCDCGTEGILGEWEDGMFFLSFWREGMHHVTRWRDRLRAIWKILTTGSGYTDQIVMRDEHARTLARWLIAAPYGNAFSSTLCKGYDPLPDELLDTNILEIESGRCRQELSADQVLALLRELRDRRNDPSGDTRP
jgi:hypothetical protein